MQQTSHAYRTIPFTKVAQMSHKLEYTKAQKKSAPTERTSNFLLSLKRQGLTSPVRKS